ncbi:hypothetical protein PoB_000436200 [Plakobranchus ocellatus]|uniref:Uncharacterized protein n=1 Tax=Plakobranchus ocellatus TaxID=259542 RepID=A0AAV3Y6X8_9GAST|nr:hypothetical protein PoB_000436200 [Plakobranchus ocellatus]
MEDNPLLNTAKESMEDVLEISSHFDSSKTQETSERHPVGQRNSPSQIDLNKTSLKKGSTLGNDETLLMMDNAKKNSDSDLLKQIHTQKPIPLGDVVESDTYRALHCQDAGQIAQGGKASVDLQNCDKQSDMADETLSESNMTSSTPVSESKSWLTPKVSNMTDSGIALIPERDVLKNVNDSSMAFEKPYKNQLVDALVFDFSPARQKTLSASSGFNSCENLIQDSYSGASSSSRFESMSSPLFSPIYFQPVSFKNLSLEYPIPREIDRKANEYLKLLASNAKKKNHEHQEASDGFSWIEPTRSESETMDALMEDQQMQAPSSEESLLESDPTASSICLGATSSSPEPFTHVPFEELDRLTQMAAGARPKTKKLDGGKKKKRDKRSPPSTLRVPSDLAATGVTLIPSTSSKTHAFSSSGDLLLSPSIEDPFDDNFRLDTTGDDTDVFLDDTDDNDIDGDDGEYIE